MKTLLVNSLLLALFVLLPLRAGAAPVTVVFNTSPLVGMSGLSFDALLIDGDGGANTSIVMDLFNFGGGAPIGAPVLVGGASGSLGSSVALNDASFFADFTQHFQAGTQLAFRVNVVTTASGDPQPEGFQFSILDANGLPVATTDPSGLGALLVGDISTGGTNLTQYAVQPVPEPSSLVLVTAGGFAAWVKRRVQRNRARSQRRP